MAAQLAAAGESDADADDPHGHGQTRPHGDRLRELLETSYQELYLEAPRAVRSGRVLYYYLVLVSH